MRIPFLGTGAKFAFTNDWFDHGARPAWDLLIPKIDPHKILEIGSYEGASTCYLIEKLARSHALEIHCVDTWEGGVEHGPGGFVPAEMGSVESRFQQNLALATSRARNKVDLVLHKGYSDVELAKLLVDGKRNYFDFIYVDGSHQAPDVLCDAILSFRLLAVGGVLAFDDYLWQEELAGGTDPIRCPKPAIDAFTNLYCRKIRILPAQLYQLYVRKIAD